MKKLVVTLVLVTGFLTTTFAQEDRPERQEEDFEKLSVKQRTTLHLKRITLHLDLTYQQANQIKPLLEEQAREQGAV